MNNRQNILTSARQFGRNEEVYYTLLADQLQIHPPQKDNSLEIVYYRFVPPLSLIKPLNWLSTDHPDIYIFGALVEVNGFVKDSQSAALWEERYSASLGELRDNDLDVRWGQGTPLRIRTD